MTSATMLRIAVVLVTAAATGHAYAGKERAMAGQAKYDPSFWWFGYGQPKDLPLMKKLGLDGVGFTAGSRDGEGMKYYFDSPTLRGCDWAQQSSERENLTEYAARAHAAGLKVMANLEGVSPGHSEAGKKHWTPELASKIMMDVRHDGADRWFTEDVAGWPDIFFALADTGRKIGLEYQEGDDPGYVHYSHPETGQGFVDIYRRGHMISLYHYQYRRDELGKSASLAEEASLGYAFARTWGLPTVMVFTVGHNWGEPPEYWEGILRPSIAIRALQFRLDEFDLIGLDDEKARQMDVAGTKQWVAGLVARNAQEKRPLLDVVAQLRQGEDGHWDDLAGSGDAITCGAFHAGWNVVASTEPRADADAYYLYTTGRDERGTLDLTPETTAVFAGKKPVFLQIGATLPSGATSPRTGERRWRRAGSIRRGPGATTTCRRAGRTKGHPSSTPACWSPTR